MEALFHVKQFNPQIQSQLEKYVDLLLKWNKAINLISDTTIENVWDRHIYDCAQLEEFIDKDKYVADLGSGPGLPGAVLSILGYQKLSLIEVDEKKVRFLKEVRRQLGLEYEVIGQRIEHIGKRKFDVITSRALASLEEILGYAEPYITENSSCVLLKGKGVDDEIKKALLCWDFEYLKNDSKSSCEGTILEVKKIRRK